MRLKWESGAVQSLHWVKSWQYKTFALGVFLNKILNAETLKKKVDLDQYLNNLQKIKFAHGKEVFDWHT